MNNKHSHFTSEPPKDSLCSSYGLNTEKLIREAENESGQLSGHNVPYTDRSFQ